MYSLLIALAVSIAAGSALRGSAGFNWFWTAFLAIVAFGAAFAAVNWILRRRIMAAMTGMQRFLEEGQKRLQAKIKDYQFHPKGDPRQFQEKLQREQKDMLREAIARTSALERFRGWVPFMQRQINTTRMQLWYQLKRFKEVDAILPRCLVLDPLSAAMKLARQYSNGAAVEEIEKTYRKARLRLRYNQSAFLSSVMAWIYVKRDKLDEAHRLLDQACKDNNTEQEPNASLVRNRDALANNRVKQFSNAAFADQWYALFLEEPKVRYERRAPARFGRFG